jgi:hypothetical protein
MPIPLLVIGATGVMAWVKRALMVYGAGKLWDQYGDNISAYLTDTTVGKRWLTDVANYRIASAGIDGLVFDDIFDAKKSANDVDKFVARYINHKIGSDLTGVKSMTRDELLTELGSVVARRLNAEAGTSITNVHPVSNFRAQLGMALVAQLDTSVIGAGSLLTAQQVQAVRLAVARGMDGYRPPKAPSASTPAQLASNRARQKKYRDKHVAVWVPKETINGS